MSIVLGVDLGGTRLRAAWTGTTGEVEPHALDSGPAPGSTAELAERVAAHAATAADEGGGRVASVAVTIPGLVQGTRCRWVPNLPYLDGEDLAELLAPLGARATRCARRARR